MKSDIEHAVEAYAGTLWEAQLIQSLLENAEIESYLVDSLLNAYAFNPSIAGNVKVMISSNDIDQATIIINDYYTHKGEEDAMEK